MQGTRLPLEGRRSQSGRSLAIAWELAAAPLLRKREGRRKRP